MLNLRNINPMVRAVGTMGAVSALVGGITFAQLTSNTVALSDNQLSTASAHLKIGLVSDVTGGSGTAPMSATVNGTDQTTTPSTCDNAKNGSVQGFDLIGSKGLAPGGTSDPLNFCLENTGGTPLDLTAAIPQAVFTGDQGIPADDVTLTMTCDNGGTASDTLDQFDGTNALGMLAAGASTDCQATLMLSPSFTNTTKETLPNFDIQFVGTESSSSTPGSGTGTGTGTGSSPSSTGTSGTGTGSTGDDTGTDNSGNSTGTQQSTGGDQSGQTTTTTGSDQSSSQSQG